MRILSRTFLAAALLGLAAGGAFAQCACSGWPDPFRGKPEAERTAIWTQILKDTSRMLEGWEDALAAGKSSKETVGIGEDTKAAWRSVLDCFAYHPPVGYAKDDTWFDETVKVAAAFDAACLTTRNGQPAAEVLRLLHEARACVARLRQTNKCATMGDAAELLLPLLDGIEQQTVPDQLKAYSQAFGRQLAVLRAAHTPAAAKGEPVHYEQAKAAAAKSLERLQSVVEAGDTAQVKAAVREARKALGTLYDHYGRDLI